MFYIVSATSNPVGANISVSVETRTEESTGGLRGDWYRTYSTLVLSAPQTFQKDGRTYEFSHWESPYTEDGYETGSGNLSLNDRYANQTTSLETMTYLKFVSNNPDREDSYERIYNYHITVVACYDDITPITYTVSTSCVPSDKGTTTGDGEYNYGETCTITVKPKRGWKFLYWKLEVSGVIVSSQSYTYTVYGEAKWIAYLEPQEGSILYDPKTSPHMILYSPAKKMILRGG